MKVRVVVCWVYVYAANRLIDVKTPSSEEMNKSSKVAGSVKRKDISRVWYEPSLIVDLAASMKQTDVGSVGDISTALVLGRMAIKVTLFDSLDD